MNFLQLLASGASILNFNFQSKSSQSLQSIPKLLEKPQGFKKVHPHTTSDTPSSFPQQIPTDQANLFKQILQNERQELINRYLQLNLQLMEGKVSKPKSQVYQSRSDQCADEVEDKEQLEGHERNGNSKKKIKKPVKCGHDDKAHYAKGMCNNCYHKYGRTKKPWNCSHEKLYAGGMCQNCYINLYNKKKRDEGQMTDEKPKDLENFKEDVVILMQQTGEVSKSTLNEKAPHEN